VEHVDGPVRETKGGARLARRADQLPFVGVAGVVAAFLQGGAARLDRLAPQKRGRTKPCAAKRRRRKTLRHCRHLVARHRNSWPGRADALTGRLGSDSFRLLHRKGLPGWQRSGGLFSCLLLRFWFFPYAKRWTRTGRMGTRPAGKPLFLPFPA